MLLESETGALRHREWAFSWCWTILGSKLSHNFAEYLVRNFHKYYWNYQAHSFDPADNLTKYLMVETEGAINKGGTQINLHFEFWKVLKLVYQRVSIEICKIPVRWSCFSYTNLSSPQVSPCPHLFVKKALHLSNYLFNKLLCKTWKIVGNVSQMSEKTPAIKQIREGQMMDV